MAREKPWETKWIVGEKLTRGGQGTTFHVTAKDGTSRCGVLKVLNNQNSEQARRRMHREVTNLQTLFAANARVPQIIDGNTDEYASNTPLYFVMEWIQGRTLEDYVAERGHLPIDEAIEIALGICATVEIGHRENIVHRDLKPNNIMLRDGLRDVVILDYGLSFNKTATEEGVTETDERFRNEFLTLPETNVAGGDRRDPRSDLTAIAGILYFCLTGRAPQWLRDSANRPPHLRSGGTLQQWLGDVPVLRHLDTLFHRAFAFEIDNRLQTLNELSERLVRLRDSGPEIPPEEPQDVARRVASNLLQRHRATQIKEYSDQLRGLWTEFQTYVQSQIATLSPFSISIYPSNEKVTLPQGDTVGHFHIVIGYPPHSPPNSVLFAVAAIGNEAIFYRQHGFRGQGNRFTSETEWTEVLRYHAASAPPIPPLLVDLKRAIGEAIELLEKRLLSATD